jgi:ubiquitin-conjugating enzyme E2 M
MDPVPGAKVHFPDTNNIMKFEVSIKPSDGLYANATFQFTVDIPNSYPYDPPKVLCNTMV